MKGTLLFTEQENIGVTLMKSLDPEVRERVRIYSQLSGPELPS